MKTIPFFFAALLISCLAFGQNNIGINNASPSPSAALMVDTSATGPQGMLVPRMTQARRNAIASPVDGLMIYQTDGMKGFYYYNGSAWTSVSGAAGGVKLELQASKTAATQTLPNANGSNLPDPIIFENVTVTPTVGTYNSSTSTYTTGAAGVYLVHVKLSAVQNATPSNTTSGWSYVEVNGVSPSVNNNYFPYISSGGGGANLPTGFKGVTNSTFLLILNAGDNIRIKGLNQNSAATNTFNNDGGCQFIIVKLT